METSDLLDGFAAAIGAVGTRRFEATLLRVLATFSAVDHLTILTYREPEGLRTLGVASRVSLSVTRSLTRDYVATHHVLDPNYAELTARSGRRAVLVRRHDPTRLPTRRYQERFYTTVGIVDKISFLWHAAGTGYYVNAYRTVRSGVFQPSDTAIFASLGRIVAALVRLHDGRGQMQSSLGGAGTDVAAPMAALLSDQLSPREAAVVAGILKGMRTEGIAIELGVKPASVITFRRRAYAKLGIATQAELFACCLRALPGA